MIAIEDRRFYEHEGVDYKGIARALCQDMLRRSAAQGGSTITQQFVKNALAAQGNRSVFQKLREAALAYHLERKWTQAEGAHPVPEQRLLRQRRLRRRGRGAHLLRRGRPDADRPHRPPGGPGDRRTQTTTDRAARDLTPAEAALLAGMIASPSMYDPVQNPRDRQARAATSCCGACSSRR